MVTWSYNGSDTVQAVCTGLESTVSYDLVGNDGGSTPDSNTSDGSGNLTLTITDVAALGAGDTFVVQVRHSTGDYNPAACIVLKYGTSGGTDQSIGGVTWSYNGGGGGTGDISVTFPSTIGITYRMQVFDGGTFTSTTVAGDGSPQTLSDTVFNYTTETSFIAHLYNDSTFNDYSATLFETGIASSGSQDLTGGGGGGGGDTDGRVLIAWDDGPLEPNPVWTSIDQGINGFPVQFVAGYDTKNGRQTLTSQTETGTARVFCNDHELGLFDDRNMSSPYQGKLSGRQILLQLWDPVVEAWEPQFRGIIDDYSYDVDGSGVDANGDPLNVSVILECVDMFDYLEGFGLTPGLAGVIPPVGAEDGVYYAGTTGTVDERIIEILTDANIDPDMYGSPGLASGNVRVIAVKYDPDESALTAIRDAVDAEFPFIGNCYCDRYGKFQFRGRYGRFDPDAVSSEPGSEWDFTRWAVGDQKAILSDPNRAQMRVLAFARSRQNIINVASGWTQGLAAADMPNQVFADTSSITAYGQHAAPPMSDLLTDTYAGPGTITPDDGKTQAFLYAKLLVKNQAFPREALSALQVKAMPPDDDRAAQTWAFITRSDISHIVNVAVGYPGGTGFAGDSPRDDYYIEGRSLTVRPLNPTHDYVEYNVEVTPAVWSMDTHNVFPTHDGDMPPDVLTAEFSYAQ